MTDLPPIPKLKRFRAPTPSASGGFALVLTLSLMALLVLLLVSLSALTRVEQAAVGETLLRSQARQQAILGAQVALGRLQAATGPDARVTARADLFADEGGANGGVGLEEPRWVGVWDASEISDFPGQREVDQRSRTAKLDSVTDWLVSGANRDALDPAAGSGPEESREIVLAPAGTDPPPADSQLVRVPLEPAGSTPGGAEGFFAYFIDDEGVKARVDLEDPFRESAESIAVRARMAAAQRTGPEAVLRDFPVGSEAAGRILDRANLALAPFGYDVSEWEAHFGMFAAGVLSDPVYGGLKKDLTLALRPRDFADAPAEFQADPEDWQDPGRYLYYVPNETMLAETQAGGNANPGINRPPAGPAAEGDIRGPRWDLIHDFVHMGERLGLSENETVEARTGLAPAGNRKDDGFRPWRSARGIPRGRSGGLLRRQQDGIPVQEMQAFGEAWPGNPYNAIFSGYDPATKDLVRPPLSPTLTEFRLYLTVGFDANDRPVVRLHPYVELTNPYDAPLRIDGNELVLGRFAPLIDFRFTDTDPTPNEVVTWSTDGFMGGGSPAISPRYLGAMARSSRSFRNPEEEDIRFGQQNQARALDLSYSLTAADAGVLDPGETRSFVLGETIRADEFKDSPRLRIGEDWESHFFEMPVRDYDIGLGDDEARYRYGALYGDFWPVDPGDSGPNAKTMNDYDRVEISLFLAPFYEALTSGTGNNAVRELVESIFALGHNEADLTTFPIPAEGAINAGWVSVGPYPFELARDAGLGDVGVGDGIRFEISAVNATGDWSSVFSVAGQSPLLILQFVRESADEISDPAADAPTAESVFGQSNPRAYVLEDASGLEGAADYQAMGWRTRLLNNPNSGDLADGAWGKSNNPVRDEATVLFHLPREEDPLASVGAFRHAFFGVHAGEPTYLVGNGRRPRTALDPDRLHGFFDFKVTDSELNGNVDYTNSRNFDFEFWRSDFAVDSAFYVNRALWDRYFFSTVPEGWDPLGDADQPWPNDRWVRLPPQDAADVADYGRHDRIASRLLTKGAFNVNSTSAEAWAAVLASLAGTRFADGSEPELAYPRTRYPAGGAGEPWSGRGELELDDIYVEGQDEDEAIESLSEAIVREVRERGPFLSLAHFINRQLVADERGETGALEAAIAAAGLNDADDAVAESPAALSQHDFLEPLGPFLSARSDTFVIHAVGQWRDPSGDETVSAACEMVVQRVPEYVDTSDDAEIRADALTSPVNGLAGRRYEIVSFRWKEDS